jgi:hypothetical protein
MVGEDKNQVSFYVKLTLDEFMRYNFSLLYSNWIFALFTAYGFILFLLQVAVVITLGFASINFFPIFIILISAFIPIIVYFSAKRNFNNRFIQEEKEYTITENGFFAKSDSINASIKWTDIIKFKKNKKSIYLFVSKNSAFLFPKWAIGESNQAFLEMMIKKHVKVKKQRKLLRFFILYLLIFFAVIGIVHFIAQVNTN